MDSFIYTKEYFAPPIDRREILRYARVKSADPETEKLLDICLEEAQAVLNYKVCYGVFAVDAHCGEVNLGFTKINSSSLCKNMSDCEKALAFCATVGTSLDRLIAKYTHISPSRAVILHAIGTERVEALCDAFCEDISKEFSASGYAIRPRFSPGYGDLPLELQRDIFSALEPHKHIGVALNDNLFMSPSKSVTALVGLKK